MSSQQTIKVFVAPAAPMPRGAAWAADAALWIARLVSRSPH